MKTSQKLIFVFSLILAGVFSFQIYEQRVNTPEDVKAAYLPAGDFELETAEGKPFSSQSLRGLPYVLYFGFTSCPDVCPLGLTVIRDALNSDARLADVPAVLISVDPERDSGEGLRQYAAFFHENIIPVRGDLVTTHAVAKQYGTYFIKAPLARPSSDGSGDAGNEAEENEDPNNYTVDHTAYYFVIDGDGALKRVLEHNAKAEDLASALLALL